MVDTTLKENSEEMSKPQETNVKRATEVEVMARLQILLDNADSESNKYWQRNSVFVTINSGLFALLISIMERAPPILFILFGMLGVGLSMGWLQVLRVGKYYAERWRLDARKVLAENRNLEDLFQTIKGQARISHPSGPKSSGIAKLMSISFLIVWSISIGYGFSIAYGYFNPKNSKFFLLPKADTATNTVYRSLGLCIALDESGRTYKIVSKENCKSQYYFNTGKSLTRPQQK